MKKIHIDLDLDLADDIADSILANMDTLKSDLEYYFDQKDAGSAFISRETLESIVDEILEDIDDSEPHSSEITTDSLKEMLQEALTEVLPDLVNANVQTSQQSVVDTEQSKEEEAFNSDNIITFSDENVDENNESNDSPFTEEEMADFGAMFGF